MGQQTFHEVVHQVDIGHLRLLLVSLLLHFLSLRLTRLRLGLRDGTGLLLGRLSFLLSAMLSTSLTFPLLLFGLLGTSIRRLLLVGI